MDNKQLGDWGEQIAANYLESNGYTILATKYKVKTGEIDIIAQTGAVLVFVEVKTRRSSAFGTPAQAVDLRKQQKIVRTAQWYLNTALQHCPLCRFDVIEIYKESSQYRINQIENAFEAGELK